MIVKQGEVLNNRDYGPIYPMEFRYRTCEKVDGENTRTCHCAEGISKSLSSHLRYDSKFPRYCWKMSILSDCIDRKI